MNQLICTLKKKTWCGSPTHEKKPIHFARLKGEKKKKRNDPDGTRTHNPQLRRLMPYPLGHRVRPLYHRLNTLYLKEHYLLVMLYSTFNQFLKLLQANNVDINNIISSLRAGGTSSNA